MVFQIDNKVSSTNKALTILQAFEIAKIEIPRFCYHEKLNVAGNCRMCLVEVVGTKKPMAACALPVTDKMSVLSSSVLVKKAREGILEFILANHPLDCPICDQGGECDLQEQSLLFGSDKGRFYENKRVVLNKNCGPFIKTIMSRCIHCTRCVRFASEIAGISYLGVIGRGQNMEISSYLEKILFSEVSGNIIDLCPVGALTSKPYAFTARPWELLTYFGIDIFDSLCPEIRFDIRDRKVLRILPRYSNFLMESWISDKTRFVYDSFFLNRLNFCFESNKSGFISKKHSWHSIFISVRKFLVNLNVEKPKLIYMFNEFMDLESATFLKKLLNKYGNGILFLEKFKNTISSVDFRFMYTGAFNFNEWSHLKFLLFVNINVRYLLPIINIKIKQFVKKTSINIFYIGENLNLNYYACQVGKTWRELCQLYSGKHKYSYCLRNQHEVLILSALQFSNFFTVLNNSWFLRIFCIKKLTNWNVAYCDQSLSTMVAFELNLLHKINQLDDVSFKVDNKSLKNIQFFVNVNSIKLLSMTSKALEIYQGHHLSPASVKANFIFPSFFYLEKNSTFLTSSLHFKKNSFLFNAPILARNDLFIYFYFFKQFIKINFKIKASQLFLYVRNHLKYYICFKKLNSFTLNYSFFIKKKIYFFRNISFTSHLVNFFFTNHLTKLSVNLSNIVEKQKFFYTNFY